MIQLGQSITYNGVIFVISLIVDKYIYAVNWKGDKQIKVRISNICLHPKGNAWKTKVVTQLKTI